ncbi:hypothetical protein ACFLS4_01140 [Bacteroidota bacterium]
MKKLIILSFVFVSVSLILSCDKPDALKEQAYLEIENNSSSYDITGVYYANSGYGTNRISINIGPGGSQTFTLGAEDDYIYNIMVTSDNPNALEYSNEDVHFYDDRRITIRLTESDWDTYYPW